MIIVADSGSTKTDWALIKQDGVEYVQDIGLNPYFLSIEELSKGIYNALKNVEVNEVQGIYFYGAGTSSAVNRDKLRQAFKEFFPRVNDIVVDTDLHGAAKALFKDEKGIACILGTGSNSCLYNGKHIEENVNSLGYMLGDNGSGAVIGHRMLKMYLRNKLPKKLKKSFETSYNLDYRFIIDRVYRESAPNRFFASFSPFVLENINEKVVKNMVKDEFKEFIEYFIKAYKGYENLPIRFVGSIAYNFREILEEVFNDYGLTVDSVTKNPIEELVKYYSQFVEA